MCIAYRVTKLFSLLLLSFVMTFSASAFAGDTGLANALHTIKKERGKYCMVGHFHYGVSKNEKTKKRALKAAKRAWMSFTIFEYGSDWSSFHASATKSKSCTKAEDGTYGCNVSARPCKGKRRVKRRKRRRARR